MDRQSNMLVGFANMVVSLWESERPRTVFVGVDSIGSPTYRHELLPGYQSGRDFPPDPAALVTLGATFDGDAAKGTWSVKGGNSEPLSGTWVVKRK